MFGSYILIPQLVEPPAVTGYGFGETTTVGGPDPAPERAGDAGRRAAVGLARSRFGSRLPLMLGGVFAPLAYFELALFHETLAEIPVGGALLGSASASPSRRWRTSSSRPCARTRPAWPPAINTIMRSIGGSIGAQVAAAMLAGHVILGGRFPAENGFTERLR